MITSMKVGSLLKESMKRMDMPMKSLAKETRQTKQAISSYATNYRPLPIERAKEIADVLKDPTFSQHLSAMFFNTLSPRKSTDLSSDNVFQLRDLKNYEEDDCKKIEDEAFKILMFKSASRDMKEKLFLRRYAKEMGEELTAEILFFFSFCEHANIDATELIKEINEE